MITVTIQHYDWNSEFIQKKMRNRRSHMGGAPRGPQESAWEHVMLRRHSTLASTELAKETGGMYYVCAIQRTAKKSRCNVKTVGEQCEEASSHEKFLLAPM